MTFQFLSEEKNVHETPEGEIAREKALKELETLCCEWVRGVCRLKNFNETVVQAACVKVYTFGSYRLGIHGTGTPISPPLYLTSFSFRNGYRCPDRGSKLRNSRIRLFRRQRTHSRTTTQGETSKTDVLVTKGGFR